MPRWFGLVARTLRGIGMASFELRDYVAAFRAFSAALVDNRKALTAGQREHTRNLLERSLLFVGIYTLETDPPDARVVIDGQPMERGPDGKVLLSFGSHILEASKPGYRGRTISLDVRGGERKKLIVSLAREAPALGKHARPAPPAPTAPAISVGTTAGSSGTGGGWYWGAGGAALLGLLRHPTGCSRTPSCVRVAVRRRDCPVTTNRR